MIQAVIFDCDGMVVDSDRVSDRVMKEFGTPIETINSFFGSAFCLIGHKKPEPEFFQYIVSHVDEPKENILFCDDDENNIAGAEVFGLQTFFYTSFDDFKQKVSTI